ncbi:MAG: MBL fold metallo-hydrolase, partial [Tannerella sp.]|nr:MBL fold metallo-hydrolase [Tannerella sp.]
AGPGGHLSNRETADFLATYYTPCWKNIWLCHLSQKNNSPTLAYHTVARRMMRENICMGIDVTLHVLERKTPSEVFLLEH